MRVRFAAVALGLVATAIAAPRVYANFHLMKIVAIFPGTAAAPTAQYVVLQMYSLGQNAVSLHHLHFYDSHDTEVLDYTIPNDVANFADQSKIIFATAAAKTFFSMADMTPAAVDFTLPGTPIHPEGGKVCFDAIPIDCVAWGNYSHAISPGVVGTLFRAVIGLESGKAVRRRLDVSGNPTLLEAADDTDDCANDFREAVPAPVNNAGTSGTIPASTCGNGAIEGLEECDDNNTAGDDLCDPICSLGRIHADGFETEDFSRWTARATDGSDLVVGVGGMINGTFGALGTVNDTNSLYVEDTTPVDEDRYRVRFRFDSNTFDPGEAQGNHRARVLIGFEENPQRRLFAVVLRRVAGDYALMARARIDDNSQVSTPFVGIIPGPHVIEVDWRRSTSVGTPDGQLRFWVDGTLRSTLSSLENSISSVDFVRMGVLNIKTGASGSLKWDDFDSRRTTYVGP